MARARTAGSRLTIATSTGLRLDTNQGGSRKPNIFALVHPFPSHLDQWPVGACRPPGSGVGATSVELADAASATIARAASATLQNLGQARQVADAVMTRSSGPRRHHGTAAAAAAAIFSFHAPSPLRFVAMPISACRQPGSREGGTVDAPVAATVVPRAGADAVLIAMGCAGLVRFTVDIPRELGPIRTRVRLALKSFGATDGRTVHITASVPVTLFAQGASGHFRPDIVAATTTIRKVAVVASVLFTAHVTEKMFAGGRSASIRYVSQS